MTQRIARMDREELIANAKEVIDAAHAKLNALCHGERWVMSVPVQDSDSDIPLGAVIRLAAALAGMKISSAADLISIAERNPGTEQVAS